MKLNYKNKKLEYCPRCKTWQYLQKDKKSGKWFCVKCGWFRI